MLISIDWHFFFLLSVRKCKLNGLYEFISSLVNEAADKYFVGNAQLLRKLEALEESLGKIAKIVVPTGSDLVNIIGDMDGIVPLIKKQPEIINSIHKKCDHRDDPSR